MIKTENITINGREFVRTYSDLGHVKRDGVEYSEAIDPAGSGRTYTEVIVEDTDNDVSDAEIINALEGIL